MQGSPYDKFQLWVITFFVMYRDSGGAMVYITDSNGNQVYYFEKTPLQGVPENAGPIGMVGPKNTLVGRMCNL